MITLKSIEMHKETKDSFTIINTINSWKKEKMTCEEVNKFYFNKISKSNFNPICVIDYIIIDEKTGETYNMSNMRL